MTNEQPNGISTRSWGRDDFPGIGVSQPIVGLLALPAVYDRLPKDPVLVAQPVAHRRQLQGRHRVEEASRQASKAAVAEARISSLVDNANLP